MALQAGHNAVVAAAGALRRAAQFPLVTRAHGVRPVAALSAGAVVL